LHFIITHQTIETVPAQQCPFAMHWNPCRSMPSKPAAHVVPAGEPTT